eukprot:2513149-Rhodomonas_salina.1
MAQYPVDWQARRAYERVTFQVDDPPLAVALALGLADPAPLLLDHHLEVARAARECVSAR